MEAVKQAGAELLGAAERKKNSFELERKLKPYEDLIEQFQAIVLWRNFIGLGVVAALVNIIFIVVRRMNITLIPALIILTIFKIVGEIVWNKFSKQIKEIAFKPVNKGAAGETNRIRSLSEICDVAAPVVQYAEKFINTIKAEHKSFNGQVLMTLGILAGMFFLTLSIGSYRLTFLIVNGILFVPGLLCYPPVNAKIKELLKNMEKPKTE